MNSSFQADDTFWTNHSTEDVWWMTHDQSIQWFHQWWNSRLLGVQMEKLATSLPLVVIMLFTMVGNVLVVISIFTYNPLRNVQNMFLVSLAISDITVAVCVMPFSIAYYLIGEYNVFI